MQGLADSPLTDLGRAQVADHVHWLRMQRCDRLLSSPLGRARASARILGDALGLPVEIVDALRERSVGALEGLTRADIAALHPLDHQARMTDPHHWRPPAGESHPDLHRRLAPLLRALLRGADRRPLLVAHGTLGRAILALLLDLPPDQEQRLSLPNDVAWRVEFDVAEGGDALDAGAAATQAAGPAPVLCDGVPPRRVRRVVHVRDGVEQVGALFTDEGGDERFERSAGA